MEGIRAGEEVSGSVSGTMNELGLFALGDRSAIIYALLSREEERFSGLTRIHTQAYERRLVLPMCSTLYRFALVCPRVRCEQLLRDKRNAHKNPPVLSCPLFSLHKNHPRCKMQSATVASSELISQFQDNVTAHASAGPSVQYVFIRSVLCSLFIL